MKQHLLTTPTIFLVGTAALFAVAPAAAFVGAMDVPHTFQAGTPARAAEVNENFMAMAQRIADLEQLVDELREKTEFMTVEPGELEGLAGPHVVFEGVNVHVRSGSGSTEDGGSPTGLGNLVIGYDELGTLSPSDRDGAHNLVLGSGNAFTSVGGIVAGMDNAVRAPFATITGGRFGTASGRFASISGGGGETSNLFNNAEGDFSSITGGFRNVAAGNQSSVTGGSNHQANGFLSAVSGGTSNTATGAGATVSGGAGNNALGANSAVSGGQGNQANGVSSSVTGGLNGLVSDNFDCANCNG